MTTLASLRRFTVARTLFTPTTLRRAVDRLGFVQADPIRAPARAQDLTLRHRVAGYRVGDLDRAYGKLAVEEDFFINYGFVTHRLQALMHPRPDLGVPAAGVAPWTVARRKKALLLLEFVRERGAAHPRDVDAHFAHGKVENYWGGSSNATTQLLDAMHYRGLLRVVRREGGVRVYAAREHGLGPTSRDELHARLDALVDAVVQIYAPMPASSFSFFVRRLRFGAPQWRAELTAALRRAGERVTRVRVDGVDWVWPVDETPDRAAPRDDVRLLAPFDPVVQDRARFELLWGWAYRFEAYTPLAKRKLGYYALPLLWRDRVIGWGNASMTSGTLDVKLGYVDGHPPRERTYARELEAEIARLRESLAPRGRKDATRSDPKTFRPSALPVPKSPSD